MPIQINNVPRRVVYAASGVGPYAFTFEILAAGDIAVFKDDALLTLTTNYTVTIAANGTGSITLTADPTGATQIAIVGNRTIQRTTDFTTGGDFFANTLNDELDQQTIFAQQNAEGLTRSLQAPQTDPTSINMILPRASVRANKTLAFNSTGAPTTGEVIGDNRGNWSAGVSYNKRDIVKDTSTSNIFYANTAHTSSGSQPLTTNVDSAKWDVLVDAAAASTSATNAANSASTATTQASNASTSATNSANSATAAANSATTASNSATSAANAQAAAEAALDSFDDRYLGSKTANPTLDNDGNALLTGALYFNSVDGVMKVYTGSAWVAASVSASGLLTVANNLSELTATASTARTNIGLGTGDSPQFTAVNIGNSSDTTVTRASAGVIAVEGSNVLMASNIGGSVQAYDVDTAKTDVVQTFTAAQTFRAASAIRSEVASTQDAIVIAGRAGGTTSRAITLTPASLGASRTATMPDPGADYTVGFRNVPLSGSAKTTSYSLTTDDIGEYIEVGSGGSITIPNSTFAAGDVITVFNNTSGAITITCSITDAYIAGTDSDKATMSLATRGLATILFISGTRCVVQGNVS